jgi:fructose-bisphosphate aldolase class II
MLVNATQMLQKAVAGKYAIGAFNTNDLEWCHSIMTAAEETQSPLIIQCSMGAGSYQTGYKTVSALVHAMYDALDLTVPVALHLDHGSYDACLECIEAGFTSVMYDGSHEKDFETNLANTANLVKICHDKGISIEAEVGSIGGVEDGIVGTGEVADPAECKAIAETGVDFLAAGIGNIHGLYPENWAGLNFEALAAIKAEVGDLPLVLHGGTGIPEDQIKKAISLGVAKINVNTELQVAFANATVDYVQAGKAQTGKGYDPRKLLKPGADAITATTIEKIKLFGSDGKGWN